MGALCEGWAGCSVCIVATLRMSARCPASVLGGHSVCVWEQCTGWACHVQVHQPRCHVQVAGGNRIGSSVGGARSYFISTFVFVNGQEGSAREVDAYMHRQAHIHMRMAACTRGRCLHAQTRAHTCAWPHARVVQVRPSPRPQSAHMLARASVSVETQCAHMLERASVSVETLNTLHALPNQTTGD